MQDEEGEKGYENSRYYLLNVSAWPLPRCLGCRESQQFPPSVGFYDPQAVTANFGQELGHELNLEGQTEVVLGRKRQWRRRWKA